MSSRQDLIKAILRLEPSHSFQELESFTDTDLIVLKARLQFEYERHNINLFRKGYSFHGAKRKRN
jgi:hypothetical protein